MTIPSEFLNWTRTNPGEDYRNLRRNVPIRVQTGSKPGRFRSLFQALSDPIQVFPSSLPVQTGSVFKPYSSPVQIRSRESSGPVLFPEVGPADGLSNSVPGGSGPPGKGSVSPSACSLSYRCPVRSSRSGRSGWSVGVSSSESSQETGGYCSGGRETSTHSGRERAGQKSPSVSKLY